MTTAQIVFSIALAVITLIITAFAIYVVGSSVWGDRWFPRRSKVTEDK